MATRAASRATNRKFSNANSRESASGNRGTRDQVVGNNRQNGNNAIGAATTAIAVNEIQAELIETETAIIVPQMEARSAKHNRKSDEGTPPQKWHVACRENSRCCLVMENALRREGTRAAERISRGQEFRCINQRQAIATRDRSDKQAGLLFWPNRPLVRRLVIDANCQQASNRGGTTVISR